MSQAQSLEGQLLRQVEIDDAFAGRAHPEVVKAVSRAWPTRPEWSQVSLLGAIETDARRIEEYLYTPAAGGRAQPVGVVFETTAGRPKARLYAQHQWTQERTSALTVDPNLTPTAGPDDVLSAYFDALERADLEAALRVWEPDGYLQHSNGERFQGLADLRARFTHFFNNGPIKLAYCNKTDDGRVAAYEAFMPHGRLALAIYERGASGKLAAARLYL